MNLIRVCYRIRFLRNSMAFERNNPIDSQPASGRSMWLALSPGSYIYRDAI